MNFKEFKTQIKAEFPLLSWKYKEYNEDDVYFYCANAKVGILGITIAIPRENNEKSVDIEKPIFDVLINAEYECTTGANSISEAGRFIKTEIKKLTKQLKLLIGS